MTRRAGWIAGVAGLLGSLALLLLFAAPTWSAPWAAAPIALTQWQSPSGRVVQDGDAVRIESEAAAAVAQHAAPSGPAEAFRYLHYNIGDVARDARVIVSWRGPEGAQRRLLPRVAGRGSIDLSASPGWRGEIESLSVVVLPVDYLAADAVAGQAMRLHRVDLRPDNIRSAVTTLLTDWLAPRPWSGASINSSGSELGQRVAPLTAFVACLVAWWVLVWRVAGGGAALRRALPWVLGIGVALLVLDLARDLLDRTLVARSAQARTATTALPLAADPGLASDIAQLRTVLVDEDRIVVHGTPPFQRDYAVYLLRDADVGGLYDFAGFATQAALNGMVFVVAGGDDVLFDEATSQLELAGQRRPATLLWQGERLRAYRLGSAGEAR